MATAQTAENSFDIIFAGGGATACVTAGRLAAADSSLKILILEAGPHTREVREHIQPARYFGNLTQGIEALAFHVGKKSEALAGRSPIVPVGHAVGGGSSVNFMVYTRAAASDYDDWETVYKNEGWGSKSLIPLLKQVETYHEEANNSSHGTDGPLQVSFAHSETNVADQFLEVAAVHDKDIGFTDDLNDFTTCNKYARWARYISPTSGRRSDAAHHFIYNQADNKNLNITVRKRVVRVLFEGTRATGVEYVDEVPEGAASKSSYAFASRLVVLSSGAFGSPAILERSGLGAKEVLQKNGIQQIVDLPGVGEHYMDHNLIFAHFIGSDDAQTMDSIFHGDKAEIEAFETQWLNEGKGQMAHNGLDAGVKLRPNEEELKQMGPAFANRWETFFANAPDKPVMLAGPFAAYTGVNPDVPRGKYFSMVYFSGYPVSTGHVHITSGLDAHAPLDFDTGFLNDPADLVILRWSYKRQRELARRMPMYRGELVVSHPVFPSGSDAQCGVAAGPVPIDAPKIVYSKEDDEAIDLYHRLTVETTWHSIGTCAMKPREQGGVVDPRLNVYGTQNLKITDLSITPENVGANTYNTALAVGEKAAIIIAEDLGINLKWVKAG